MTTMMDTLINALTSNALELVLAIAAMFLVPLAKHYAGAIKDERLRRIAVDAIGKAEELGRQKRGTAQMPGLEKLDTAVAHVLQKVPGISGPEAVSLVHANLPRARAVMADFATATLQAAMPVSPSKASRPSSAKA